LDDLLRRNEERLRYTLDVGEAIDGADVVYVAVGTPPTYSGDADLSSVHAVVDAMPASDRHALVMKSTVPVGTGESIERVFAEQRKGFRYVSCPEFLKEGSAVKDFLEPDRVVIGDGGDWAGDADLSRVRSVVDDLRADGSHVQIMKSTVPAGTGESIRRDLPGLAYVSCPEFLKEGSAVEDFMNPDRVVIGADPGDEAAADAVAALYEPLGGELLRTDVASAEMIKLASNAFLATKISFINEIANVCEEVGADVAEVAHGMGLDQRIGAAFLRAGVGYGGSCFPKDVKALKQLAGNTGYHFQLLTAVIEVNELQKRRVIGKLEKHLGSLLGKRVALLGLAFKADTDDMREASSLVLSARLQGEGAEVVAYDPVAAGRAAELLDSVEMAPSALEALEGADAAVLVTEWSEFAELDWAEAAGRMARPLIVDGRNFLDAAKLQAAGFEYEGIGRSTSERRIAAS
ncbi:MAG TPA: UDP-glucose/GDP-mannose dehydrogenase family protein, partial [Thermoanaerobaculia bacterium]|nr:UDP-glucose/GDP-mannose dehydrogenase family protein [Thermoanaerobaculia bacterium]